MKEIELVDYLFTCQDVSVEAFCFQLEMIRKHAPKVMVEKGLDLVDASCYYILTSLGVIKGKIVIFCHSLIL